MKQEQTLREKLADDKYPEEFAQFIEDWADLDSHLLSIDKFEFVDGDNVNAVAGISDFWVNEAGYVLFLGGNEKRALYYLGEDKPELIFKVAGVSIYRVSDNAVDFAMEYKDKPRKFF